MCIFDNEGVNGEYVSDKGEFVCITPRFQKTGRVPFTIKFTSGKGEEEAFSTIFSVGESLVTIVITRVFHHCNIHI